MIDSESGKPIVKPSLEKEVKLGRKHNVNPTFMIFLLRKALVKDIFYGLPGTDGGVVSVFYAALCQSHTIVSIFRAHPLHPFSRFDRVCYLMNIMSWIALAYFDALIEKSGQLLVSILLGIFFLPPIRALNRFVLQCSCLYTSKYYEDVDKDDGRYTSLTCA